MLAALGDGNDPARVSWRRRRPPTTTRSTSRGSSRRSTISAAGRAGWNLVTSQNEDEALNFSQDAHMDHGLRYERAQEFWEVVTGLWDSWDDDAIIRDRSTGKYIRPSKKLHVLDHVGKHFKVKGPLNVARSAAGASDRGAGRAVRSRGGSWRRGRPMWCSPRRWMWTRRGSFYQRREGADGAKYGRNPDHLKIMPGIRFVLGATEAEAQKRYAMMLEEASESGALWRACSGWRGTLDLRQFPLDGPLPELPPSNAAKARQKMLIDLARRENLSIRELGRRFTFSLGHKVFVGTPEQLADFMQEWFEAGRGRWVHDAAAIFPAAAGVCGGRHDSGAAAAGAVPHGV